MGGVGSKALAGSVVRNDSSTVAKRHDVPGAFSNCSFIGGAGNDDAGGYSLPILVHFERNEGRLFLRRDHVVCWRRRQGPHPAGVLFLSLP